MEHEGNSNKKEIILLIEGDFFNRFGYAICQINRFLVSISH